MGNNKSSPLVRLCFLLLIFLTACSAGAINNPINLNSQNSLNQEPTANVVTATFIPTEAIHRPTPTLTATIDPVKSEPSQPEWFDFTNANYIRTLLIDQQGNLWTGGSGGAVYWNTTSGEYTKYTVDQGLPSNFITDIAETADGAVWFSSCLGGVTRFDGKNWNTFTTEDGLISDCVMSLAITTDGIVWAGSVDGLNRYDGEIWTKIPLLPSLELYLVRVDVITEGPDGDLWIGALGDHSLLRFDGENWIDYSPFLPAPSVMAITFSPDRTMWVGGEGYLASFKNGIWQTHPAAFTSERNIGVGVSSIAVSESGTIWVGFTQSSDEHSFGFRENMVEVKERFHGVSRFENGIWITVDEDDGLAQNEVTDIAVDSIGNVSFGTYNQGVSKLDQQGWQTLVTDDEIPTNWISNLTVLSSKNIWITYPNEISFYDGQTWKNFERGKKGNIDNAYNIILSTPDGSLWMYRNDGLFQYKDQVVTAYPEIFEDKRNPVYSVFMKSEGQYIFLTMYGVYLLDGFIWSQLTFLTDISEFNYINDLVIDNEGNIWVITDEAIYVFRDENLKEQYKNRDGLLIGYDNKLLVDQGNTIWVGSSEGLSRFDGKKWTAYKEEKEKIGYVRDMELDSKENVWVLSNSGLFSFDGTEWTDHKLKGYYTELEIDENGTVWLASDTLTKYIPAEGN